MFVGGEAARRGRRGSLRAMEWHASDVTLGAGVEGAVDLPRVRPADDQSQPRPREVVRVFSLRFTAFPNVFTTFP